MRAPRAADSSGVPCCGVGVDGGKQLLAQREESATELGARVQGVSPATAFQSDSSRPPASPMASNPMTLAVPLMVWASRAHDFGELGREAPIDHRPGTFNQARGALFHLGSEDRLQLVVLIPVHGPRHFSRGLDSDIDQEIADLEAMRSGPHPLPVPDPATSRQFPRTPAPVARYRRISSNCTEGYASDGAPAQDSSVQVAGDWRLETGNAEGVAYSHSMVAGGFEEMS